MTTDTLQERERQAEEYFAIFQHALDAILITDNEGRYLKANPAACKALGRPLDRIIGHTVADIFFPDQPEAFAAQWARFLQEGTMSGEIPFTTPDGTEKLFHFAATAHHVPDRHLSIMRDVTELHRMRNELESYVGKLEESNRELEQFAMVASHDLQAPLRKVMTFSDYIQSSIGTDLPAETRQYIDRMQAAVERMQTLVEDLLALSRINRGSKTLTTVDLNQTIAEVESNLHAVIKTSGASLDVDRLPVLKADQTQMLQLFQNLVENALKFHKPGHPPEVRVYPRPVAEGQCPVVVEDKGIGIDPAHRDRIYEVFERLNNREYEGSGIGLAICRKIVSRHGGRIEIESEKGQGSRFIVYLPCAETA